jgi:hypothetical protein
VVVFPLAAALISLACAAVIARDAVRRPRPDKITWAISFVIFAIAAGAEVVGGLSHWTPFLARVYYLTGAVLVVGYLALGELYLLAPGKIARFAPGAALMVTAVSATVVFNAAIDRTKLASDGWEAIDRGPGLIALAAAINGIGTVVIVAGLGYSAWKFKRLGIQRNRMIGCLLIVLGTLIVATGGTLTRFGHREFLYIPMAIGAAVIFAGYLWTRTPDGAAVLPRRASAQGLAKRRAAPYSISEDAGIAFIETRFLALDDARVAEECRIWSVPRDDRDAFDREEARAVWAFRLRLSPQARDIFDEHSVPARRQLAQLYACVLTDGSHTGLIPELFVNTDRPRVH